MRIKELLLMACVTLSCTLQAQDLTIHVNKKGKVGFVDKSGTEVIKCQYESAQPFSDGYAIVTKSGKSGIIDQNGNVVLPLKYESITSWNKSLYLIKTGKKKLGLCRHNGKIVLPAKYSQISKPNCYGKALIATGGKIGNDASGKYSYLQKAKFGIIDDTGNILITPKYCGLYEFSCDTKSTMPYFEGMMLAPDVHFFNYDTLKTDCKYLGYREKTTYWNIKDDILSAGILDEKGNKIIKNYEYSYVMQPQNNMVRYYKTRGKRTICGYYNIETGKEIEVATFKDAIENIKFWTHGDFIGDIAPVNGDKWKFIDKSGNTVRNGYKQIKHGLNDLWAAQNESGKWKVFDGQNKDIAALSNYDDILCPQEESDQETYVVKKGSLYGAITKSGEEVIPFQFDNATPNTNGVIAVAKDGKWGMFSDSGEVPIALYRYHA